MDYTLQLSEISGKLDNLERLNDLESQYLSIVDKLDLIYGISVLALVIFFALIVYRLFVLQYQKR